MIDLDPDRPYSGRDAAPAIKACRVHRFGGPEVIVLEEVPRPKPGAGEVLVRVEAAGVGTWDGWIRAGRSALPQPLPLTLGSDLSGVVAELGTGVSGFAVGTPVFGVTNARFTGAYADYAVAAAGMIARRPGALASIDAASVPVVAVTAWQALFEEARLAHGQSVLVHGAGGNVGRYAVQFARRANLRIVATASTRDLASVRALGANEVIDHRTAVFDEVVRDMDAVVDLVGGDAQARSLRVLRRGGRLVSAVSKPDQAAAKEAGVEASFFLVEVTTERLNRIASLIEGRQVSMNVGAVLPLESARTAHEILEGDQPSPGGKIILVPGT